MTIKVVYHDGARIADPRERARVLAELVDEMRKNPLPPERAKLTRDEMHERN